MPDALFDTTEPLIIVSLPPTKRDPNRTMIRVAPAPGSQDSPAPGSAGKRRGKVVATMSHKLISDLGLYVGQPWDEKLQALVNHAAEFDKAFRAATRRLARRAMSTKMIADKLRELGHPQEVGNRVIERLEELDLLDDAAYGEALIRDQLSRKAAGPRLLQQKLYQKGIRGALADRLIHEATADDDEQLRTATEFARKRAASLARYDAATRKRRLYGQLARRGFTPDVIRSAMEAVNNSDDDA